MVLGLLAAWAATQTQAVEVTAPPMPGVSFAETRLTPLPPLAAAQAWPTSMLGAVPGRSYLPSAVFTTDPRRAEAAKQHAIGLRATFDRPVVAWDTGLAPQSPYLTPAGPLAYTPSTDSAALVPALRATSADQERAVPAADPAMEASRGKLLSTVPEMRCRPAPFLKLSIPDPAESLVPIRLTKPPPDIDPPAASYQLPPKPPLPTESK